MCTSSAQGPDFGQQIMFAYTWLCLHIYGNNGSPRLSRTFSEVDSSNEVPKVFEDGMFEDSGEASNKLDKFGSTEQYWMMCWELLPPSDVKSMV